LRGNETSVVTMYARFGRIESTVRVRWVPAAESLPPQEWDLGAWPTAATSTQQLVLVCGDHLDWTAAWQLVGRQLAERPRLVQATSANQLPHRWLGWEAFDVVVITAGGTPFVDQMSPPQWQALREWVRLGGRVL